MTSDKIFEALHELFDDSFEGILALDQLGRILYANPKLRAILALPEQVDPYLQCLIDASEQRDFRSAFSAEIRQPETQIPVALRISKNRWEDCTVLHVWDETEKKEQELLQIALFRISSLTALAEDLNECYAKIHGIINELMYAKNFFIAIYNEETDTLSFEYHVDEYDPCPGPKKLDNSLTAFVIKSGESYFYSVDKEALEREKIALVGHPSIDWIGVPLKIGGRVYGAMVIQSYEETVRFTDREKNLLNFVTQHIAIAIERKRIEAQLKSLSLYDELTHLYNRRGFLTVSAQQLKMAARGNSTTLLFFIDLDNMKIINDRYGHGSGDQALRATASVLHSVFRDSDIIARLGGDEFVALAVVGDRSSVDIMRSRVREGFCTFNHSGELKFPLEISMGIAVYDARNATTVDALIAEADKLMYEEKKSKKTSRGDKS